MRETDVLGMLREAFPESGLGDDAAVLPAEAGEILLSTDAVSEGVHFRRKFSTLSQAVQKLFTSNISDIFAMGGTPDSMVLTAGLPKGVTESDVADVIGGVKTACAFYGVRLVGGDTVESPGGFFFNAAVTGRVRRGRAIGRSGASAGERIVLFGKTGSSLAGLELLNVMSGDVDPGDSNLFLNDAARASLAEAGELLRKLSLSTGRGDIEGICGSAADPASCAAILTLVKSHLVPSTAPLDAPLVEASTPVVSAMIDISDGLSRDIRNLCMESGTGALVEESSLDLPPEIFTIGSPAREYLTHLALSSGEEYFLLAAVGEEKLDSLPQGCGVVGTFAPGVDGIMLLGIDGNIRPLPQTGYEHLF